MKKLQYIEISRGVAALLVVLHHATLGANDFYTSQPFENIFYFGKAGIDFFFVLSGFIIYYIHSNDEGTLVNIKNYVLKRIIRVYPIFLFISIIMLSAHMLLPQWSSRLEIIDFSFLATSLLLLPSPETPILSVSWTLVHEMCFYFVFILFLLNKKIGLIFFAVWALMILMYNLLGEGIIFPYTFYLSKYNLEFIFGIIVAFLIKSDSVEFLQKYTVSIFFIGVIVFFFNGMNVNYELIEVNGFLITMIYGLSSSMMILGLAVFPQVKYENILLKIFLLLGAASYSIYLLHVPLQSVLHRIVNKFNMVSFIDANIIFLVISLISIIGGIILYMIIEKPTLKYLRKKFILKKSSNRDDLCAA